MESTSEIEYKLCLVKEIHIPIPEEDLWLDLDPLGRTTTNITLSIPLYDHPHSDKENGQVEVHYHQDNRYVPLNFKSQSKQSDFLSIKSGRIVLPLEKGERLQYVKCIKISNEHSGITPVSLIKKSKLKHKCIHKGKCPHRGYDLSNETPDEHGVITCPLHGLRFNSHKKLILK